MTAKTFELQFAKFIERFRDQIKEAFLEDTFHRRDMFSHSSLGRQTVEDLADKVLSEFTTIIDRRTTLEFLADPYVRLGLKCHEEGISYSEMIRVFILLKRHIWLFFQESNFAGQPFDVRSIVALNNRTALFFDRAIYYFLFGYEESETDNESELDSLYKAFLVKLKGDLSL